MRVDTVNQGSNLDFKPPMGEIAQESRMELLIVCL
jgi:hypothetical protein